MSFRHTSTSVFSSVKVIAIFTCSNQILFFSEALFFLKSNIMYGIYILLAHEVILCIQYKILHINRIGSIFKFTCTNETNGFLGNNNKQNFNTMLLFCVCECSAHTYVSVQCLPCQWKPQARVKSVRHGCEPLLRVLGAEPRPPEEQQVSQTPSHTPVSPLNTTF